MSTKLKGPTLYFSQFGGMQPIPPEFVAAMDLHEQTQPVPNDSVPDALSDTVVFSRLETNRTDELVRHTYYKKPGTITLRNVNTNQQGQPVQVTRVFFRTGTQSVAVPTATTKVAVQDLGNGWSIQESTTEGTYVGGTFTPGIFAGDLYKIEIPEVIPLKFRAIVPIIEEDATVVGQAQLPTLGVGDLSRSEEQIDEYTKRVTASYRDIAMLPVSIVSEDTNDVKQVVIITETLMLAGVYAVPSATKTVLVENLGDGTVLQTQRDVGNVFPGTEYIVDVPELIPEKFRVLLPMTEVAQTLVGQASNPILGPGDIRASDVQLTEFTHRLTTGNRTLAGTPTLVGYELIEGLTATVTETLAASLQTISSPTATTLVEEVENLGRDGAGIDYSVKVQKDVGSFPPLYGQQFNEVLDLAEPYVQQTLSTADAHLALGSDATQITPKDYARAEARTFSIDTAILDAYIEALPVTIERILFPAILTRVDVNWETAEGKGDSNTTGTSYEEGGGTLYLNLPNSSQGSATVVPDVVPVIQEVFAERILAMEYIVLVPKGTSTSALLAKLSTIAGGPTATVNPWPLFQPVSHVFTCKGERLDVRANASTQLTLHIEPGSGSGVNARGPTLSYTVSQGNGGEQAFSSTVRSVTTKPVIHGTIVVGGETTLQATAMAVAQSSISGIAEADRTVILKAKGSVTPGTLAATPGLTMVPTTGLYAYDIKSEGYRKNYAIVRVTVVDFATLRVAGGGVDVGHHPVYDTPVLSLDEDFDSGTGSDLMLFSVVSPVTIGLANLTSTAGTVTTFSASPSGTPPFTYQWYKDGMAIAGATGANYSVSNTTDADSGSYVVVVANMFGSVASNAATLTVNSPVVITVQPISQAVYPMGEVEFSVAATGTAPILYQWYKTGVAITGATSPFFPLSSASSDDAGNYRCIVSNGLGSVISALAVLSVDTSGPVGDPAVPPTIVAQPVSDSVVNNSNANFGVAATGTLPLTYQWYKNGTTVTENGTAANLLVAFVTPADSGAVYTVTVTNTAGSVTSDGTAILTVTDRPVVIMSQPKAIRMVPGIHAVFNVAATGDNLTYQWYRYHSGTATPVAGGTSLVVITNTLTYIGTGSIEAEYYCVVTNGAGSVTSTMAMLLLVADTAPPVMSFATPVLLPGQPYPSYSGPTVYIDLHLTSPWTEDLTFTLTTNGTTPIQTLLGASAHPTTITIPAGSVGPVVSTVNGGNVLFAPTPQSLQYTYTNDDYYIGVRDIPSTRGFLQFAATGQLTLNGTVLQTLTAKTTGTVRTNTYQ